MHKERNILSIFSFGNKYAFCESDKENIYGNLAHENVCRSGGKFCMKDFFAYFSNSL